MYSYAVKSKQMVLSVCGLGRCKAAHLFFSKYTGNRKTHSKKQPSHYQKKQCGIKGRVQDNFPQRENE